MTQPPQPPEPIEPPQPPPRRESARAPEGAAPLFERIGGRETVRRIVDAFYDGIEQDSELRPMFPRDMESGREKQRLFLEQWLGGAPGYSEQFGHPRLRRRHFPFVIDQRAAGRWLHHMGNALRAAQVPEHELQEILAALGQLARHMVNVDEDVPREPLGDVRLT